MTRDTTTHARTETRTPPLAPRARTPRTLAEWAALLALTLTPLATLWALANPLPATALATLALAAVTTAKTAPTLAAHLAAWRPRLRLPWADHR